MVFNKLRHFIALSALAFILSGCTVPGDPNTPAQLADIVNVIKNIIGILAPAAGIAFFFMILVGGFQFLMSGGDPKATAAARNTMTYALIGIILVVASWIVILILQNLLDFDFSNVRLPASS